MEFNQTNNNAGDVHNHMAVSKDEAIAAVQALCQQPPPKGFNGDYQAGFNHYADSDGLVRFFGVERVLKDAGVGTIISRAVLAELAIKTLDTDGDGAISWDEFQAARLPTFPLSQAERNRYIVEIEVHLSTELQMSVKDVRRHFAVTWPEQSHYPCVTAKTGAAS